MDTSIESKSFIIGEFTYFDTQYRVYVCTESNKVEPFFHVEDISTSIQPLFHSKIQLEFSRYSDTKSYKMNQVQKDALDEFLHQLSKYEYTKPDGTRFNNWELCCYQWNIINLYNPVQCFVQPDYKNLI